MSEVVSFSNYARSKEAVANTGERGVVRHFTQSLNMCSLCGSSSHRASKCPLRVQNHDQTRET